MRSSMLSRGRQLGRICDGCRQERNFTTAPNLAPVCSRATQSYVQSSSITSSHARLTIPSQIRWLSTSSTPTSSSSAEQPSPDAATTSSFKPQPPQTYYDIFPLSLPAGPPPDGPFEIDVRALRREFLQLQGKAHPDLHPPSMKARAEAMSARINEAFKTLSSPLLRAQYLLSLQGLDVANDETAKVEDPALLMEVMEAREEVEEAEEESELEALRRRNEERERESEGVLAGCFGEGDWEGAVRECVRLRYWCNIKESIHNWERGKPIILEH
ncbi:Co-chaperone HscB, C-terminal oligomerization domain-containing protein [Pseudomassariella vexata]|uniref:Co-chaperone HscB, C-terminal oligomerization domain-containing protein n=1 Tax=Pseudomassariella vexata TaxID=1141098 RepID=A0A1Y2DDZ9_9PEZI|nr:Co-chaperone HscB, C-terminal oligomerization domain-containing protein [Pseudomassariella vexata]ORY57513.1 Co-chaperone HscB, C-terminal oligomerization domain-containing protein [Pseudomassariella vexata]